MQLGSQHHQRPAKASMGSEPPRTPGGRGGVGGWGVMFGSPLPQHGSNQTLKFQGLRSSSPPLPSHPLIPPTPEEPFPTPRTPWNPWAKDEGCRSCLSSRHSP